MTVPGPWEAEQRGAAATSELIDLVRQRFGLQMVAERGMDLQEFVRATLSSGAYPDVESVLKAALAKDPTVWKALAAAATVGETYFFRFPQQLAVLRELLRTERSSQELIFLWSAGCASGEEAYTLAIVALEVLGNDARFTVVGTDINEGALERAEAALYREWSFRGVAPEVRARWFEQAGEHLRPIEAVRAHVTFERMNLLRPEFSPDRRFFAIFCRNVLVYLSPERIVEVRDILRDRLAPNGVVVLAPSDPGIDGNGLRAERLNDVRVFRHGHGEVSDLNSQPVSTSGRATAVVGGAASAERPRPAHRDGPRRSSRALPTFDGARPAKEPSQPIALPPRDRDANADAVLDRLNEARILADTGDAVRALSLLEVLIESEPACVEPYLLKAELALELGDPQVALRCAERALLLDRRLPQVHFLAASAALALGAREEAARHVRNTLRYLSGWPEDHEVMPGVTAVELEEACRSLRRGLPGVCG